jgi:SdpI/YfhL protein family
MPSSVSGASLAFEDSARRQPRIVPFCLRRSSAFQILKAAGVALLFLVTGLVSLARIGSPIAADRAVWGATGALLVVLGNDMGRFTRNFLVGIRAPWTLASDEIWLRTHRLASRLFVLAGLGLMLSAVLGKGIVPLLWALIAVVLVPLFCSLLLWLRHGDVDPRRAVTAAAASAEPSPCNGPAPRAGPPRASRGSGSG